MFVSIASSPASRSGSCHGATSTHVPSDEVGEAGRDVRHRHDRARARVVVAEVVLDQPRGAVAEVAVEPRSRRAGPRTARHPATPGAPAGTARNPKSTSPMGQRLDLIGAFGVKGTGAGREYASPPWPHRSSASACSVPSRPARRRSPTSSAGAFGDAREPGVRPALHRGRAATATRRGRARSSRTSRGSTAGTRTSSPTTRGACCSATPTRSRRPCSTRSTWARRRPRSTTSSRATTTCSSSAGSTCPGAATASASSRRSAAGCTSATSSGRATSGRPWLLVEGGRERAPGRGHGRRRTRCSTAT